MLGVLETLGVGPGAQASGGATGVGLGEELRSLTAVAKRGGAPYVRGIEPTGQQGPRTQQDIDRELRKNVDYAAMALGEKGILETGKAILKGTAPEMSEEEVKAAGLDRPWARDPAAGVAPMWEGWPLHPTSAPDNNMSVSPCCSGRL